MTEKTTTATFANFIAAAGVVLAVSYPILALSTGFRALFQLVEGETTNMPWLTLIGAFLYTVATIGFVKQPQPNAQPKIRRSFIGRAYDAITPAQAWRISVIMLVIESGFTLIVGLLSYLYPDLIGRNIWTLFGRDYGYFPLVQPLLGVLWLFHPITQQSYHLK